MSSPQQPPDTPTLRPSNPDRKECLAPSSSFHPRLGGALLDISTSASSLFHSIANPSVYSVTNALASSSSSSSTKPIHPQYPAIVHLTHSHASAKGFPQNPVSSHLESTSKARGFQGQPLSQKMPEDDFNEFSKQPDMQLIAQNLELRGPRLSGSSLPQEVVEDGLDAVNLLFQPLTSPIYSIEPRVNTVHPAIYSYANCEDPAQYLSSTFGYVEEVWGDNVEGLRQAQKEVLGDAKRKGKQDAGGAATARLKMISGHLYRAQDTRSS